MNLAFPQISSVRFNRKSVQRAIKSCIISLRGETIPKNGLIVFASDSTTKIVPPKPLKKNFYLCDRKFHPEEFMHLYEDHELYLYIAVVSAEVLIFTSSGTKIDILWKYNTKLSTNTRRGGQSSVRFSRLRDEQRHVFIEKILEHIIPQVLSSAKLVIVAGNGDIHTKIFSRLKDNSNVYNLVIETLNITTILEKTKEIIHDEELKSEKHHHDVINNMMQTEIDSLVFGNEIEEMDNNYLVKCIYTSDPDVIYNAEKILLKHLDYPIGVLYFTS